MEGTYQATKTLYHAVSRINIDEMVQIGTFSNSRKHIVIKKMIHANTLKVYVVM